MRTKYLILPLALFTAVAVADPTPAGDDLGWLAGHWCSGDAARSAEELWMPAKGGLLLGLGRTAKGERVTGFEYLRIMPADGVPTYIAQPGGKEPTAFARTQSGPGWIRFENPQHDFPQRIEYRRTGDSLRAEIAGPGRDGKEMVIGFDYAPCPG